MENHNLDAIRHSAAHMLAAAVLKLYPGTKLGIGPTIDNGFYYDFQFPEGVVVSDKELPKIQKEMKKIIQQNAEFKGRVVTAEEARAFEKDQPFKLELIADLEAKGEELSLYESGTFTDLCRGGHVNTTKEIPIDGLKLQSVAGAYWKGNEKNPMLSRIYGVLFATKEELEQYLHNLEEAKKRDHRVIGQDQQLFFIDELVGKGLILWQPNGMTLRNEIEHLAVETEDNYGYVRVATPHLAKEELFLTSGHLPYYKEGMYPAMQMDDGTYYMKAMNCPLHHVMYRHTQHSYREMPVRLAEYGTVYRNELSGTLAGLLRVRGLTMNDAHIYCRKDQVKEEFKRVMEMTQHYFELFGLKNYWFRLSKWDPTRTEKYINEPANWEFTEQVLREVLEESGVPFVEVEDEAAFYGPKVDVQFKSAIGREETMSTIQLDFTAKQRFELSYTDEKGEKNGEVFVIHRAPLSTHERFTAFVIEHFAGAFPLWLSPVQVSIIAVGETHKAFCTALGEEMRAAGIRVEVNNNDETVGKKIRNAVKMKIPYMLVVGDKEMGSQQLMVRKRGEQDAQPVDKNTFLSEIQERIRSKSLDI